MKFRLVESACLVLTLSSALAAGDSMAAGPGGGDPYRHWQLKPMIDAVDTAFAAAWAASTPAEREMLGRARRDWMREWSDYHDVSNNLESAKAALKNQLARLTGMPQSGPGMGRAFVPVFLMQEDRGDLWFFNISTLRFADPQTAGERLFNAKVKAFLDYALAEERESIETYKESGRIWAETSVSFASPKLLSVHISYDVFEQPSPYGTPSVLGINIDLGTGREIALHDIVDERAVTRLAKICDASTVNIEGHSLKQLAGDDGKDFNSRDLVADIGRWWMGEDKVVVYLGQLWIHAVGDFTCSIPMAEVKRLARPGAPLP